MAYTNTPELFVDFNDKCSDILEKKIGLDHDDAVKAADLISKLIRDDWGGQQIYFAKCAEIELSKRDIDLWNKFKYNNHAALAREFNVSVQWVYKVVKYMGAREISSKQIDAFPDEDLQNNSSRRHA